MIFPKIRNRYVFLLFIMSIFFMPLHSCDAKKKQADSKSKNLILYEDWEAKNFDNWDDDFAKGDSSIEDDPVYDGKYAVKQRASKPGSLVHFFGDHPGVNKKIIEDVTLESYLYFPANFKWPSNGVTIWTMACFESWKAGYTKAKGRGKPLSWAPYYVMIALKGNGLPMAFLTRADNLGSPGDSYLSYGQNIGETAPIKPGSWVKLKFRLKLNTLGKKDGIFKLWIDDDLKCNYSDVNFRGSYKKYGWNHLMMSFLGNRSKSDSQWISRDNIRLITGEEKNLTPKIKNETKNKITSDKPSEKLNQAKAEGIFLKELFEDNNFSGRGWYDNTGLILSDKEHIPGSKTSVEFCFKKGAKTPVSGSAIRRKIPETESVYVSYYVKYSSNWEGSNRSYHPHELYLLTNKDGEWTGPAYTHLTAYIEQNEGEPMLAIQDGKNIDEAKINVDLTGKTENRAVTGCNGNSDGTGKTQCYRAGNVHCNGKNWRAGDIYFSDLPGDKYKNDWHFIEAFFKLNSIVGGKGVVDGVAKYWFDGKLILNLENILLRTGMHPDMRFNQLLIGPWIGDGSPVEQTIWIDDLTVAKARSVKDIKILPKTHALPKSPTGLNIIR